MMKPIDEIVLKARSPGKTKLMQFYVDHPKLQELVKTTLFSATSIMKTYEELGSYEDTERLCRACAVVGEHPLIVIEAAKQINETR